MPTAIIYTRFSPRPNEQECDSCKKQEERCRAYCQRKNYSFKLTPFNDEGISGGILERPALRYAIEWLEQDKSADKVLVVDSPDRLARDMLVALTIQAEVEKAGGRIEYANGVTPSMTPEGRLFGNILAAFAAYERDRVRFATSRGMQRRQENGESFGKAPAGYKYAKNGDGKKTKLVEDEKEQEAIHYAKQLADEGVPSKQIAMCLTHEFGLFRGNMWNPRTVRRILQKEREKNE